MKWPWVSRKRYFRLLRRLVLAERVADAALERKYEHTERQRLDREVHELRYAVAKACRAFGIADE